MSDISTPNVELFQRVLDHIHTNPSEWYQMGWGRQFSCGTAYCMAGTAMALSEDTRKSFHWEDNRLQGLDMRGSYIEDFEGIGSELLGINSDQGSILFVSYNSMVQLFALSHVMTDGATTLPEIMYNPIREAVRNKEIGRFEDTVEMYTYAVSPERWDAELEDARLRLKAGINGENYQWLNSNIETVHPF